MKVTALIALAASLAAASPAPALGRESQAVLQAPRVAADGEELYLVQISPTETRWIKEDEKWELRRKGINFMDITEHQDLGFSVAAANGVARTVEFPKNVTYTKEIKPLLKKLEKDNMKKHLEKFTSFHTRYYKSSYGVQSAEWLFGQVGDVISKSGADKKAGATVHKFPHPWGQPSLIATIPGKSNKTVVIGAHQDSINLFLPSVLAAPGADDDGSGTVTILEAFRVLLTDPTVVAGNASNTIEFHWYSAEEGGLLGSQAIFSSYEKTGRDVRAMLQQDMTGFVERTLDAGMDEAVGVITDFVDPLLTEFIKKVITAYCDIPFVTTQCGYACSDHASASKAGYPSAFVIESEFRFSDNHIHSTEDLIKYLSFDHMLQHAKLTLGLVYELAFAKLKV